MLFAFFGIWLLFLNIILTKFTHIAAPEVLPFNKNKNNSHSLVRPLGCFQCLTNMRKAGMNISVSVFCGNMSVFLLGKY